MGRLRQLVLVRHGETDGDSSVRFHGSSDVDLSPEGRAQMRAVATRLQRVPDLVVASPLRRSWRSAAIVGRGASVRLERDFREIHFGRFEGLTKEEIRARDPIAFEDWQARKPGFEYPGGELREEFRERVRRGLDRLLEADARDALVVVHKGVIRTIVETLAGEMLAPDEPAVGDVVVLTRRPDGTWFRGQHSSNPPGLDPAAFLTFDARPFA
jgi:broad specificity phosphatase PhoE